MTSRTWPAINQASLAGIGSVPRQLVSLGALDAEDRQALLEHVVYEPDGTLATGSFMHYALPRALEMPPMTIAEQCTPSPLNPLGTKGVGESGTIIGTAPIMNAVADALAPLGVTHLDMPYTAERVWAAIQRASA